MTLGIATFPIHIFSNLHIFGASTEHELVVLIKHSIKIYVVIPGKL